MQSIALDIDDRASQKLLRFGKGVIATTNEMKKLGAVLAKMGEPSDYISKFEKRVRREATPGERAALEASYSNEAKRLSDKMDRGGVSQRGGGAAGVEGAVQTAQEILGSSSFTGAAASAMRGASKGLGAMGLGRAASIAGAVAAPIAAWSWLAGGYTGANEQYANIEALTGAESGSAGPTLRGLAGRGIKGDEAKSLAAGLGRALGEKGGLDPELIGKIAELTKVTGLSSDAIVSYAENLQKRTGKPVTPESLQAAVQRAVTAGGGRPVDIAEGMQDMVRRQDELIGLGFSQVEGVELLYASFSELGESFRGRYGAQTAATMDQAFRSAAAGGGGVGGGMLFAAIKRANPDLSYNQIVMRMQEGATQKNVEASLAFAKGLAPDSEEQRARIIEGMFPVGLRKATLLAGGLPSGAGAKGYDVGKRLKGYEGGLRIGPEIQGAVLEALHENLSEFTTQSGSQIVDWVKSAGAAKEMRRAQEYFYSGGGEGGISSGYAGAYQAASKELAAKAWSSSRRPGMSDAEAKAAADVKIAQYGLELEAIRTSTRDQAEASRKMVEHLKKLISNTDQGEIGNVKEREK